MIKILLASSNKGKINEIKKCFSGLNLEFVSLDNYPDLQELDEDGNSFKENALKKARVRAESSGLITFADDSGLEVDALAGKPGIYSARYAGENASDEENNRKLLKELAGLSREKRKANFRTVAVLVDPADDYEGIVEGICDGYILESPRGNNGFGYDPLFYLSDLGKTMAELSVEEKNKISHRGKALRKMNKLIKNRYFNQLLDK